jgi:trehalose utilization protein
MTIRTLIWGENVHEQKNKVVAENYPKGMHNQIGSLLSSDPNISVKTTTFGQYRCVGLVGPCRSRSGR